MFVLLDDQWKGRPPLNFYTYDKEKLQSYNDQWYWVFKTVNEFEATKEEIEKSWWATKRQSQFLKKLNFVYSDVDVNKEDSWMSDDDIRAAKENAILEINLHCMPNCIVRSKNWFYPFYKIDIENPTEEQIFRYKKVIKWIIERSREHWWAGDAVHDVTRILRVPWFNHNKWKPYMVSHENLSDKTFTLEELEEKFPYEEVMPEKNTAPVDRTKRTNQQHAVEAIDFQELMIAAFNATWRSAEFDKSWRLILDWRLTWTFQWKQGSRDYLASTSHESFEWNRTTAVADILQVTYKEAYKRILNAFNIPSETSLVSNTVKKIESREVDEENDWPKKFSESWYKKFSTGNWIIDCDTWHFWSNELVLLHGKSKNGKTMFTMSMANKNWKPVDEWWYWHKVAFFSLEMDRKKLKTQQASIRAWISRLSFEEESYTNEQRETYERVYRWFDTYFTIFDENDLGWDEWLTLTNIMAQIKKLQDEDWYNMFIIDSLKLIWWQDVKTNDWEWKIVKELRKLKNALPINIVLIHHNSKWWTTFSGSQDLENFCDSRIEITKKMDPNADGLAIFNQSIINIHKERFGKESSYVFDFVNWELRFSHMSTIEDEQKEQEDIEQSKALAKKPLYK